MRSKPQTVGSCARVTVAPAAQPLAPNPTNLLKTRPVTAPTQSNDRNSRQQQQQQQRGGPDRAPDGVKVCDSSTYSYEELVGPIKGNACGDYQVEVAGFSWQQFALCYKV